MKNGDIVAMEGGASSFNSVREIMEYGNANVVVPNLGKLHKAVEAQIKTDSMPCESLITSEIRTNHHGAGLRYQTRKNRS